MKKIHFIVLFILMAISGNSYAQQSYSFNEGINAAKSQNKIIVINIFSENDRWSQKMQSEVYDNSKVQNSLGDFIYIKLDGLGTDSYSYNGKSYTAGELAKQFGVTSYPTHVFLTSAGNVITFKYNGKDTGSFPGFVDINDFMNMLQYFKDGKYSNTDLSTVM